MFTKIFSSLYCLSLAISVSAITLEDSESHSRFWSIFSGQGFELSRSFAASIIVVISSRVWGLEVAEKSLRVFIAASKHPRSNAFTDE